ncbi:YgcG family protein [Pseudanabaena sp. BC1403]|uniref:TPM domain-containing protein n=1 Tax=Pseudanabaena sp. BC1403 TaxID=2043171 RepID=UPI000CD87A27|nr:TPM domain-containing protein [Pseudanabaena sp. BC1403]
MSFCQRFYPKLFSIVVVTLVILLLKQPVGMAQSTNDLVNPQQKDSKQQWIYDRADLLDWQTEFSLNLRINKLVGRTSAELAIATIPKVETEQSPRAFAIKQFNALGIGKRETNNGVLLLVSKNDRRIEIITGKGLGEVLPDAEVSDLIQQKIVPSFQQQQYATGIIQGVNAIAQRLESRLPSTILPSWMPMICVWIPWLIAIAGAGWAIFSTVQVMVLSFTPIQILISTQGFNTNAFSSSQLLASYSFTDLLAKVCLHKSARTDEKIPSLAINILAGGWILGIGLIYGFWQFILMHPEAEFWQSDRTTWLVFGMAGSIGWIWGLLISWIVSRDLPWLSVAISLLAAGLLALLSGFFGFLMTTAWSGNGITVMLIVAIVVASAWAILVNPYLSFKRQCDYRSDRTGQPPKELTEQEIENVLTPREISARSLGKLEFRGWREAELTLPITREQVYLVQRIDSSASVCAHCKSYAVDVSEQTVERAIESPKNNKNSKKSDRQPEEKITSVRLVKQTVYSCHFCGCVFAYDQREPAIVASSDSSDYSSSDSSYSSTSSDSSSYDSSYSSDYGSSSSDFGGGSSDGGGAGSDW